MKKRALLLCPHFSEIGGVSYYNSILNQHFKSKRIYLDCYHTGKNTRWKFYRLRFIKTLFDLIILVKIFPKYDLIIINPSLDIKSTIRDGILHFLAKNIYKKKTIVFFHGWDYKFERFIHKSGSSIFKKIYNFDKGIVLYSNFRKSILNWGYDTNSVITETTAFVKSNIQEENNIFHVAFLSRLSRDKGCMIAIKAIEKVSKHYPEIKLFVIGDGEMMDELKNYVRKMKLQKFIQFTGWLEGDEKNYYLQKCGILLFPPNHGEGMPISILEAMGAGLAIVTRPVAGIKDILTNGINGYMLTSNNPNDFAEKIMYFLKNKSKWKTISANNKREAMVKYEIKNVIKRMEQMYYEIAN